MMEMISKLKYILNKSQKIKILLIGCMYLVGSLFELMGVALVMPLVNVISDTTILHQPGIYSRIYKVLRCKSDVQFVLLFSFGLIIIYVVKNLYIIGSNAITTKFMLFSQCNMSMDMMRFYMRQPYLFHVSTNISSISRSVDTSVNMMYITVTSLIQLANECIVALLIVGYLLFLDKSITIGVIFLLGGFSLLYIKIFKKRMMRYGLEYHHLSAKKNKWIRQSFEGIKEIKIANSEKIYIAEVDDVLKKLTKSSIKNQIINYMPRPLFEMICISSLVVVIMVKIYRGVDLSYFIPVLSAFAISAFRLLPSFSRITTLYNTVVYNRAGIDEVYTDLHEKYKFSYEESTSDTNEDIRFYDSVKFENVAFKYPNTSDEIFKSVNLIIHKNSSVALIGASGTGKTTLVDVFLGLMKPSEGVINVDGVNVYENLYSWHKLLGYIPQNIYLIDDTIRNNIVFGIPKEEINDERIWKAIEDAQLSEFIKSLPDGIETLVGERGVRVSGGQRQRIGIARALYSNPEILVLDEATSALDTDTETAVMEAIDRLKGNKTLIIIAHRLTTIRNCDYIYEIKNKSIELKEREEVLE